jgi:hypothetical protein
MADQQVTIPITGLSNLTQQRRDFAGNGATAEVVQTLPERIIAVAKTKNDIITLGTAGTVTTITLPANCYAVELVVSAGASANVAVAMGTDAPSIKTDSGATVNIATNGTGIGALISIGQTPRMFSNAAGNATMKLVADVNATVVNVTCYSY